MCTAIRIDSTCLGTHRPRSPLLARARRVYVLLSPRAPPLSCTISESLLYPGKNGMAFALFKAVSFFSACLFLFIMNCIYSFIYALVYLSVVLEQMFLYHAFGFDHLFLKGFIHSMFTLFSTCPTLLVMTVRKWQQCCESKQAFIHRILNSWSTCPTLLVNITKMEAML